VQAWATSPFTPKLSAERDRGLRDLLFQMRLARSTAVCLDLGVELEQIEGDHDEPVDLPRNSSCSINLHAQKHRAAICGSCCHADLLIGPS
jgi:hypothetical protein